MAGHLATFDTLSERVKGRLKIKSPRAPPPGNWTVSSKTRTGNLGPGKRSREFPPAGRHAAHQAGKRLAGFGDLYRLAFFNPRGDEGETVSQITDGGCFHRETNVSHSVKTGNGVQGRSPRRGVS